MTVEILGPLDPTPVPADLTYAGPPAWLVEQIRPGETAFDALVRAWLLRYPSDDTRGAYERSISAWRSFLDAAVDPILADRQHADAFARALEVAQYSANTRRLRISAVSSLYDYAIERGVRRGENPARYVNRPPVPTGRRRHLTESQTRELLEVVDTIDHEMRMRDRVILRLFVYLALRVSEVCKLDVRDVDRAMGQLVVRGKGGTEVRLDLPEEILTAVDDYLPHRVPPPSMTETLSAAAELEHTHPAGRGRTREPLFYLHRPHVYGEQPSHGPRITADAITSRLREIAAECPTIPPQLAAALSPHDLRHTALTLLSRRVEFAEVNRTARHARADTTLLYVHPDADDTGAHVLARALEPRRAPIGDTATYGVDADQAAR